MSDLKITNVRVIDLRFPTSREQIGSDAVNKDPDYSAAYCILETDQGLNGYGLTFTLGRGTELCVQAVRYLSRYVIGRTIASIADDFAAFSRCLTDDSQFRWLGPEKGVIHLATAALINAVWDLYARTQEKPVWQLLASMEPEQIASAIDFRYISDALTREEAVALLRERRAGINSRLQRLKTDGYPAYTTSVGWFGFSDEKIERLCDEEGSGRGLDAFQTQGGWRSNGGFTTGTPRQEQNRAIAEADDGRESKMGRRRSYRTHA